MVILPHVAQFFIAFNSKQRMDFKRVRMAADKTRD
jgi:hypothetical protein